MVPIGRTSGLRASLWTAAALTWVACAQGGEDRGGGRAVGGGDAGAGGGFGDAGAGGGFGDAGAGGGFGDAGAGGGFGDAAPDADSAGASAEGALDGAPRAGVSISDTPASDGAVDSGPASRPPFDWMGIIGTGQSLAVGNLGVPVSTVASPFHNLKLSTGRVTAPPFDDQDPSLSMLPLAEPIRALVPLSAYPSAYPANIFGETPHTFMANQISALYAATGAGDYVTVHSVVGESGQGIAAISKGAHDSGRVGRAYAATLFEVKVIKRLATAAGKTYGIGAIIFTHGEADATSNTYEEAVHQLWADYNADLPAITGQTTPIPMLLTQQHSAPFGAGSAAVSTLAAWRLGVDYPGVVVCAGPKYQYQYNADGRHLTTREYDRLGEKYGQVYFEKVVRGRDWQPLQPRSAVKTGAVIAVDFNVPVPPLAWDETISPPHQTALTEWAHGRGFEVKHAGAPAAIEAVAINGSQVVITLAANGDSAATGWTVGYAAAQDGAGAMAGPTRGRRGQLRDSDPFVGWDAETIPCTVTSGSARVGSKTPGAFRLRGPRDVALAAGLAANTIIVAKTSDSDLMLSLPWTGASGSADLTFHSDQRNYCVSFEMPVR
jgi:hypothetical protein